MRVNPTERYHSAVEFGAVFGRVPLALDWETQSAGNGEYIWRANRLGRSDLEVSLSRDTPSTWKSEVWTVRPQGDGKKKREDTGARGARSYLEAMKHLSEVFVQLGQ